MSRSDKFALATLVFLLGLSALMQVLLGDEGDKNWLLFAARRWIGGERLYIDVVEVNPPLILWIYGFAVWLSQHVVTLRDLQVLGTMGLVASLFATSLCVRLIGLHPEFAGNRRMRVEFTLLIALILVLLPSQNFFFDREHIMFAMTLPYVMRFMPSLARQRLTPVTSVAVGLCAALGFCIKPHSVLLFAAVQLMFRLREGSLAILWALESLIVMAAAALYFFCVWHFTPEYARIILPMALATYSAFGRSGSSLLNLPPALFCAGLTFADFRIGHATPYRRDVYYFVGIAAAFLLHTIVSNGWDYTYYPLMGMLLLLSGLVFCEYRWLAHEQEALGHPVRQFTFGMRGCILSLASQGVYMAIITILSMGVVAIKTRCDRTPDCLMQDPYVRYMHDNKLHSFGSITLDYPKWVRLAERSGARWETRFNHLWMLPGLLQDKGGQAREHDWITEYVGRALAEDLDTKKPAIVFVDTGRQFFAYPRYFDLLEFLKGVPEFKSAWSRYRFSLTINDCQPTDRLYLNAACKYDIYSRSLQ